MPSPPSPVDWFFERLRQGGERPAMIWRDTTISYRQLADRVERWQGRLLDEGVGPGRSVALTGRYTPDGCALLLALVTNADIAVPLVAPDDQQLDVAEVDLRYTVDDEDNWVSRERVVAPTDPNPLLADFRRRGAPGLVLFTSGSTGDRKGVLHDLSILLSKYRRPGRPLRSLVFLSVDHIGGVNTLFYLLANHGTVVTSESRSAEAVCAAIERHRVEVLPTSPTFLNMMLLDRSYERHDLSSLELVTYGTEPMPEATLRAVRHALPRVTFKQTYGLTELGILPTRSSGSDSLWMKLGGEGWETRVVDGTLRLRASTAMVGYLNAPSPFDADGWYDTEDEIVVDGDEVRILGRRSEVINVGGEKVHPTEVEDVLMEMDNIAHATVHGHPSPVTGMVVVATVGLVEPEDVGELTRRVKVHCRGRLPRFMVPLRVEIGELETTGGGFKKLRPRADR